MIDVIAVVIAVGGGVGAIVVGGACGPSFDPASLILEERVLAIVAEPPEAVPGEEVTLTPLVASPKGTLAEGETWDASWWRCPDEDSDALGDFTQCTVPEDRKTIGKDAPFVDVVPTDLFGALPPPGAELEEGLASEKMLGALLGYWRIVGMTMDVRGDKGDARTIDSFKRTPVYLPVRLDEIDPRLGPLDVRIDANGDLAPNTNPVLSAVLVHKGTADGPTTTRLEKGGTYWFEPVYDARALQEYFSLRVDFDGLDLADPEAIKKESVDDLIKRFERVQRCEVPLFNWYVTAGSLRREITLDEDVIKDVFDERGVPCPPVEGDERRPEAEYTAPGAKDDDGKANEVPKDRVVHAWVVMRDGRGGTATRSFDLTILE